MRERHGVPDAQKRKMVNDGDTQPVSVTDGPVGESVVILNVGSSDYPAGLSPTQARFIAEALVKAADKADAGL